MAKKKAPPSKKPTGKKSPPYPTREETAAAKGVRVAAPNKMMKGDKMMNGKCPKCGGQMKDGTCQKCGYTA